jgi:arylsulfatase A-like enzyme
VRNILLIVIDTLRADHLGCYGYQRPTSPHLDRLAARGTLLDAVWSASNFTAPAFTSLFTGVYPSQHGVFDFTSQASSSPIKTCLDVHRIQSAGVVTFRFFPNLLKNIWGGIEVVTKTSSFNYSKDLPMAVTAAASEWLEQKGKNTPFCLFVHYDGPHMPYRLPAAYAQTFDTVPESEVDSDFLASMFPQERETLFGRDHKKSDARRLFKLIESVNRKLKRVDDVTLKWMIDKYDASVRYNDDAVGKLLSNLAELGLSDDTVVAVLSDHGEEFLDHGQLSHGHIHLYEEVIRTAGIIFDPAKDLCKGVKRPLSHIAVMPTLLRLAGVVELPPVLQPLDFSSSLISTDSDHSETAGHESGSEVDDQSTAPVFCVSKFKVAVRLGRWKLIQPLLNPHLPRITRWKLWLKMLLLRELGRELYDLHSDPAEHCNLFGHNPQARAMVALVRNHLRAIGSASLSDGTGQDLDDAERKRIEQELRDLGYM